MALPDDVTAMSTNELLKRVVEEIYLLIGWAAADVEQSLESDAKGQASIDATRKAMLIRARDLLQGCVK